MTDPHLSSLTPVRSHIVGVPRLAPRPTRRRPAAAAVRALIAAAAVVGIALDATQTDSLSRLLTSFAIQANALVAIVFAAAALRAATGRNPLPPALTGASMLYVTSTALLYHFVLNNDMVALTVTAATGTHTESQTVAGHLLHTVTPIAALADWLLLTAADRYRLRHAFLWLLYPVAYLSFVLARGALLPSGTPGRYPYPFLDAAADGYHHVLLDATELAVAFLLLAMAFIGLDHLRPSPVDRHNAISPPAAGPLE